MTLHEYPRLQVKPGSVYWSSIQIRDHLNAGSSILFRPTFFNRTGETIPLGEQAWRPLLRTGNTNDWSGASGYWIAPKGSASLSVSVILPPGYRAIVDLDHFEMGEAEGKWATDIKKTLAAWHVPRPSPDRIRQIAKYLPPYPETPGARLSDRPYWDRMAKSRDGIEKIRQAEKVAALPIPVPLEKDYLALYSGDGNRSRYEQPYFSRLSYLQDLTLGECLENKGRFIPLICRYLSNICKERSWVLPAHDHGQRNFYGKEVKIELGTAQCGCQLSYILKFLGEKLPREIRIMTEKEIFRRILMPYRRGLFQDRWNWSRHFWMTSDTNWNAVCNGLCVKSALAMINDPMIRAEFIAAAEIFKNYYLNGLNNDGYCQEGIGYWNYGFGNLLNMGIAVLQTTEGKVNLLAGTKTRNVASFARNFQLEKNVSPWFADGAGSPGLVQWALMRQVWPDLVPADADVPSLLLNSLMDISLRAFGQEPPPVASQKNFLPLRTWFATAQVLLCRPAPEAKRPFLSIGMKGGRNTDSHNHNDIGSYTVALDGVQMTGDPGGVLYTRWTFSPRRYESKILNGYGHPIPVVNGVLQPAGNFYARVLKLDFTDKEDKLILDLTRAYPVKSVKSLTRTLTYDRAGRMITVCDKVVFSKPGILSVPFITYSKITPGCSKGDFTLTREGRVLGASFSVEGGNWKIDRDTIPNPKRPTVERVAATLAEPVSEASVTLRYRVIKGKE